MEKAPLREESDTQFIHRLQWLLKDQQAIALKKNKKTLTNNSLFSITLKEVKAKKNIDNFLFCDASKEKICSLVFNDKLLQKEKIIYSYRLPFDSFNDLRVFVSANLSKIIIKHWTDSVQIWVQDVGKIKSDQDPLLYAKSYQLEEQVPYHEASLMTVSDQDNQFAFISDNFLYFTRYLIGKKFTFNMTIPQVKIPFEPAVLDFNKQGTKVATMGIDRDGIHKYYIHSLAEENPNPTVIYY